MNSEFWKAIIERVFYVPQFAHASAVTTAILLFGPDKLRVRLFVDKFVESYQPTIGVIFLGSVCLSLCFIVGAAWNFGIGRWRTVQQRKAIIKRLHHLTFGESHVLIGFFEHQSRGWHLNSNNPDVIGLTNLGIIEKVEASSPTNDHPYRINEQVWEYLNENPHLTDRGFVQDTDEARKLHRNSKLDKFFGRKPEH